MTTPVKLAATDPRVAGCPGFVHQTNAAELMASDADLVTYLNTVVPGVDYFTWNGQLWQYVNNLDGSLGNTYPDVPSGNTGIFLCSGALVAPGWSGKKKAAVFGGLAALAVAVGVGIYVHKKRKR